MAKPNVDQWAILFIIICLIVIVKGLLLDFVKIYLWFLFQWESRGQYGHKSPHRVPHFKRRSIYDKISNHQNNWIFYLIMMMFMLVMSIVSPHLNFLSYINLIQWFSFKFFKEEKLFILIWNLPKKVDWKIKALTNAWTQTHWYRWREHTW